MTISAGDAAGGAAGGRDAAGGGDASGGALGRAAARNVSRFYVYNILGSLNIWMPVYILYVLSRGLTLTQATLLSSVWWLTAVVFEVPTGAIADRHGRRTSLILGCVALIAAFCVLALSRTMAWIGVAYVLWAISVTFYSGADYALLYDTLREVGREGEYQRACGRAMSYGLVAAGIGSLLGGLLGKVGLVWPIALSGVIAVGQLLAVLRLREPRVERKQQVRYYAHVGQSFRAAFAPPRVRNLIILAALVATAAWVLGVLYQPHLQSLGFSVAMIGALYLVLRLCGAVGSNYAHAIGRALRRAAPLALVPALLCVSVALLALFHSMAAVVFMFTNKFLESVLSPLLSAAMNEQIESEKRATVLSIASLTSSLLLAAVQPFAGNVADRFTTAAGFWLLAAILGVAAVFAAFTLRRGAARPEMGPREATQ